MWWSAFVCTSGVLSACFLPIMVYFVLRAVFRVGSDDCVKPKTWREYQDEANALLRGRNEIGARQSAYLHDIMLALEDISQTLKVNSTSPAKACEKSDPS